MKVEFHFCISTPYRIQSPEEVDELVSMEMLENGVSLIG